MKQLLAILVLLQCVCFCAAQNTFTRNHFNLLSVKDGMPEGTVLDLLQDKQGYMWIATQKGLVRFDGYKPKVYDFGIKDPYGVNVRKIFEDSKGRLWAAMNSGLYRYDRAHDNFAKSLQWNDLFSIYVQEDAAGAIWLSLEDTLVRFDPVTKKSETFSNNAKGKYKLNTDFFNDIYKDKRQRIWVCSGNGLYEYNAKENVFITHLSHEDTSKRISTWSIQEDAQQPGIFYFDVYNTHPLGSNEAFGRYNSHADSLTVFRHNSRDSNSIASDTLTCLYTDSRGRLWILNRGGLSLFNASEQKFTNYIPHSLNVFTNAFFPFNIKEDKLGNIWCSSNKGLYYLDVIKKQFQQDTVGNARNGLAANIAWNLFIDSSGILWFGCSQKGLQWLDARRSKPTQYGNDASTDIFFKGGWVNSFNQAPDGSIWIGANHGLYKQLPNGSFKQIEFLPGTNNNNVPLRCFYDSNGLIWIATSHQPQLYCYDAAAGKTIDYSYNLKNAASSYFRNISAFCEDHLGDIWIGTNGSGILRFNRKSETFTSFSFMPNNNNNTANSPGALDDGEVRCIYEDKAGVLWVGTNIGGLNRFNRDNGTFTSYLESSPGFRSVININEDSKSRLWATTNFGGLFMLNKNRDSIKRFDEQDGLLYDGAFTTAEDNKGNIWAATPRGISIIAPFTGKITNIGYINNFNSFGGQNAIKTKEGLFYFPTDNGFITLNPDDFTPDPEPPVVHIESVHLTTFIKDKPKDTAIIIDTVRKYNFRYNENRITFNYVGLYFKDPLATQYAYKLDGYDKDWVQAGIQRTITYTNLSPGDYSFHVKAANSDGVWSDGHETISFVIMPPWWKTWSAYMVYSVLLIAAVWRIHLYQKQKVIRAEREKAHKIELAQAKEIEKAYHELKTTQAQLIHQEKMASLGQLTAGIAHEIQNPLNFVNNFSEVNAELLEELKAERSKGKAERDEQVQDDIINDIKDNEEKISHHGKRADAIVKGMLQHSRPSSGKKELININRLADEYLRLAYHGLRAKDKSFNAEIKTDFDDSVGKINVVAQDIGRALLNLYNNAFYIVNEKKKTADEDYRPTVTVQTKKVNDKIEIIVQDNGNGIPQNIIDKIFQPFFTTKPTGQGTGLGLSLAYDIVKAHSGEIKVETKEGEGSEFIIQLPYNP